MNARVSLDVRRDGKPLQLVTGLREVPKALAGAQLDERLDGANFAELLEVAVLAGRSDLERVTDRRGAQAHAVFHAGVDR